QGTPRRPSRLGDARPQRPGPAVPGQRRRQGRARRPRARSGLPPSPALRRGTMAKEIDVAIAAADRELAVVEKASHALWTHAELLEARRAGCFSDEDTLAPPTGPLDVTSPYPGCGQQLAAPADFSRYRLVGHTAHFVILAPPPDGT